MLIGGMPQAVEAYLEHNNLQVVDEVKREIVDLYKEDFTKIDGTGLQVIYMMQSRQVSVEMHRDMFCQMRGREHVWNRFVN